MARTARQTDVTDHTVTDADTPGLPTMADAWNELAAMEHEAGENAIAVARQVGYDGTLTVGALEDEIRFYQRRTAEACIELGKRLLILKELSVHGEFKQRVELLGFAYRTASRFMQAAMKTSKSANLALLSGQVGNASKFLELLVLDDEEIDVLSSGESVRGITLDKIDTMSYSELKKALREANGTLAAKDAVIASKNAAIDDQAEKLALLEEQYMPGHVELEALQGYANSVASRVSATVRSEIVKLFDIYGNEPPAHIRLAAAQALGLIVTAAYGVAEDLYLNIDTNPAAATDNPAKRDAEEFMAWQQAQQSAE